MSNSSAAHAIAAAIALTLAATLGATFAASPCPAAATPAAATRARDLGIPFDGTPGPNNAITDVAGVLVGHTTLISGSSLRRGLNFMVELRSLHCARVSSMPRAPGSISIAPMSTVSPF